MNMLWVNIRYDKAYVESLVPYLEQAIREGLLTEEEAVRLGAEELLKTMEITRG